MIALEQLAVAPVAPRRIGRLAGVRGPFLIARGFPHEVGAGALIEAADGDAHAEVIGFDRGGDALLMALSPDTAVRPGALVRRSGRSSTLARVGPELLGRVIGPMGEALDGRGAVTARALRDVRGRPANPLRRARIERPFATGVRAIDALTTLGRGQRVVLIAGSGVGKSVLLKQMMQGREADIVVLALVGERAREIGDFVSAASDRRTVTVACAGDQPALLRVRAAQRAAAIAEHFREQGRHVLLVLDSLTRVAHAQRELGLSIGEAPTLKGYPPSSLAMPAALLERCGNDRASGGSVTGIATVLADGDDMDDPVVDAARAIADGHILLSRRLAEAGVFPAVDIARSLSRVMNDIAALDHRDAAVRARRLWSVAEDNRDFVLMGGYREGTDAEIDEALARRADILDFIRQPRDDHAPLAETVERLIAGFGA